MILLFFFFNDPATTEIYTLSLHDALPIFQPGHRRDDRDLGPEESMPARHGDRGSTTRTPGPLTSSRVAGGGADTRPGITLPTGKVTEQRGRQWSRPAVRAPPSPGDGRMTSP